MNQQKRIVLGLYTLVVVLAVGLRFWQLTDIVNTLWVDEAWFGFAGAQVLSGEDFIPLGISDVELGPGDSIYQVYASAAMQLFGVSQSYSSRYASAVMGSLSVILTFPLLLYLLQFTIYEQKRYWGAFIGTVIMATLFTGLLHSRHGLQMASSVVWTILFFYSLAHAYQTGRWSWASATGIIIGIGLTTYEAYLAAPLTVIAYAVVRVLQPLNLSRKEIIQRTFVILAIAVITWSPMIVFYIQNPGIYFSHASTTQAYNLESTTTPLESVTQLVSTAVTGGRNVWGGISFWGDLKEGRNIPNRPLFDPYISLFFWLGLLWVCWKQWQRPIVQLMLIWLLVFTLPSAFSKESPAFSRMLPMTPALAGFVGMGILALLQAVQDKRPKWQTPTIALVTIGLIISGSWSVYLYFGRWTADPLLFDAFRIGERLSIDHAIALEQQDKTVFVTAASAPFLKYPLLTAIADHDSQIRRFEADPACLPYPHQRSQDTVFAVVDLLNDKALPTIEQAYPTGRILSNVTVVHPIYGSAHSEFFEIPSNTSAPTPQFPVTADFAEGIQLKGYDLDRLGNQLHLRLHWAGEQAVTPAVSFFIHIGQGNQSDPMLAQIDGQLCTEYAPYLWEADYHYIDHVTLELPAEQPDGEFDIRIGLYDSFSKQRMIIKATDLYVENERLRLGPLP